MSNNVSDPNIHTHDPNSYGDNAVVNSASAGDRTRETTPRFVAPTHGGVDILKLLTELEDLVEHTRHGPLGVMIGFPEDQFHMTVMKIRANLPEEMKRASKLAREQERLVEETRTEAERIREEARHAALGDLEQGRAEATRLFEQARVEADRLRSDSRGELDRSRAEGVREANKIVAEAREQSLQIVNEAQAQAARLVADNEIVQQAQVIAQDLRTHAMVEADGVRSGADEYARTVLVNLETVLGKAAAQVQRGREMLEKPRG